MRVASIALLLMLVAACAKAPSTPNPPAAQSPQTPPAGPKLSSSAFSEGQPIPRPYTCDGVNISPPLEWSGLPKSAKTIAIIADDPDAPAGTWVHWVIYNLPADTMGMIENVPLTAEVKGGALQGRNDFEKIGYGGPCPPSGTHRYFFKLYAWDTRLNLTSSATRADVLKAIPGHILAEG